MKFRLLVTKGLWKRKVEGREGKKMGKGDGSKANEKEAGEGMGKGKWVKNGARK